MSPEALNRPMLLALAGVGMVALASSFYVYPKLVRHLQASGGQVQTHWCALPELLMSIVLGGALAMLLLKTVLTRPVETAIMKTEEVLPSSMLFALIVAGILGFLRLRGTSLRDAFGLGRIRAGRVLGWAVLLLLGTLPIVTLANAFGIAVLGQEATPQPLVELFRAVSRQHDYPAIATVAFAGVMVAPVCEELLFRGFFYPVGKRYAGVWVSGLVGSALFAAMHGNLVSLPGLFVLAGAFTLAYERTGSVLVPICMHALFNAASLGLLYLSATGATGPVKL